MKSTIIIKSLVFILLFVNNVLGQTNESIKSEKNNKEQLELFKIWESYLLQKGLFDYVIKSDCENFDKMNKLYEIGKYPMHIDSKNFIECDYNNDNSNDFILNYSLDNCVRGNTWITDFVFFTSKNQEIVVDTILTSIFKKKHADYVNKTFGEEEYVYTKNDYLVTHKFIIDRVIDDNFYGTFFLLQDGANCCPEIFGRFKFNYSTTHFDVYEVQKKEYNDDSNFENSNESEVAVNNEEKYTIVDEEAEFKGGTNAMHQFISKNLIYPKSAIDKNIGGKVYASLLIEIDGTISEIKIVRGINDCPECNEEVKRMIGLMPKWTPAKAKGKAVRSLKNFPISFTLN